MLTRPLLSIVATRLPHDESSIAGVHDMSPRAKRYLVTGARL
jgi:hypothetical protein